MTLFLNVDLELVFSLPDHIVSAFDNLIASLADVCKSLLQKLLPLCDLLLALVKLVSLVPSFGIKEIDDIPKLRLNPIEFALSTIESFFEDALELCDLPLVFDCAARFSLSKCLL